MGFACCIFVLGSGSAWSAGRSCSPLPKESTGDGCRKYFETFGNRVRHFLLEWMARRPRERLRQSNEMTKTHRNIMSISNSSRPHSFAGPKAKPESSEFPEFIGSRDFILTTDLDNPT